MRTNTSLVRSRSARFAGFRLIHQQQQGEACQEEKNERRNSAPGRMREVRDQREGKGSPDGRELGENRVEAVELRTRFFWDHHAIVGTAQCLRAAHADSYHHPESEE